LKEGLLINLKEFYNKTAREIVSPGRFLLIALLTTIISCSDRKGLIDQKLYEGPLSTLDSINTKLSDSASVVAVLKAPRQNNFENGDQEWPDGFLLESYDSDGTSESRLIANYVFYTDKDKLYRAEGNVIVQNFENGDELNTEELFWNSEEEKFFTDKFVTIKSDDEVHTGEGLDATQDFTEYKILKPSGTFLLKESDEEETIEKK
jgi:LPS export ABC transporter protein LptC